MAWISVHAIEFIIKLIIKNTKVKNISAAGDAYTPDLGKYGIGNDVNTITIQPYDPVSAPAVTMYDELNCRSKSYSYSSVYCDKKKIE